MHVLVLYSVLMRNELKKCCRQVCTCIGIFVCFPGNAQALYVFGDVICVTVVAMIYFFPIMPLHTCGSFTFMVIQIMKLSIRGILWWEQWTQLPPAACEMGWQTLRQMGEAALGRQSNHIHLTCFPFPLFMCSAATYQQAGAKQCGIITSHTSTTSADTFPEVHLTPQPPLSLSPQPSHTSGLSLPSNTMGMAAGGGGGRWGKGFVGKVIPTWILSLLSNSHIPNKLCKTLRFPFSSLMCHLYALTGIMQS